MLIVSLNRLRFDGRTLLRLLAFLCVTVCPAVSIGARAESETFPITELTTGPRPTTHRGVWVETGESRAFLAIEPHVTLLCFLPLEDSSDLLHNGEGFYNTGIRTWMMEDGRSSSHNAALSKTSGELRNWSGNRAVAVVDWNEVDGRETQLEMAVTLLPEGRLEIQHTLTNTASVSRILAPWTIAAFPTRGRIVLPFRNDSFREIVIFEQTKWGAPFGDFDANGFHLDLSQPNTGSPFKLGTLFPSGWAFYQAENELFLSHVAYQPDGVYPEGGANLTTYRSKDSIGHTSWGELEHVGASQRCEPGESVSMVQTIVRYSLPDDQISFETVAGIANRSFQEDL